MKTQRFFNCFRTKISSGSMNCPWCHSEKSKGRPRLKRIDTIKIFGVPGVKEVYKCLNCGEKVAYQNNAVHQLGDPNDIRSQMGNPYAGITRGKKSLPGYLSKKKKPNTLIKVNI